MKLILNLLLLFVAFALIRRAIRRFLGPSEETPPVDHQQTDVRSGPDSGRSGQHPAIGEDEVIEDAEFEELD